MYLNVKRRKIARPFKLPLMNKLMSQLRLPHSHHHMRPGLRELPEIKHNKTTKMRKRITKTQRERSPIENQEKEPGGGEANSTGGSSDDAGEVGERRQPERIFQVAGGDPLKEELPDDAVPTSTPFEPSKSLLLRLHTAIIAIARA